MSENQKKLILYLEYLCKQSQLSIRASDDELLGKGWQEHYQNFTPEYTNFVIATLKQALGLPINERKRKR